MSDIVRRVLFEHELQRRGEDWLDRRQREKREAREAEERKQQAHEAKRSEQQRRFDAAVDARIERYLHDVYAQAIAEFTSTYLSKRTKLERHLDERRSLAKGDFKFSRSRGRGDEGEKPVRNMVTKIN